MTIIEREQQILRVSQQGVHNALDTALATQLRTEVVSTVKAVLEDALQEEVTAFLQGIEGQKPHRSGFYHRALATQYGQIPDLSGSPRSPVVAPQPLCDLGEFKRFWYPHIAPTTGDLGDPNCCRANVR